MFILIVENDPFKRDQIARHLSSKSSLEYAFAVSMDSAKKIIDDNWWKLSGIILSLGLPSGRKTNDYDRLRGLDLIDYLHRDKFPVPILIYSDSQVYLDEMVECYFNVYGQMYEYDTKILDDFLQSL